jgi:RNA-directed DNA polymerase
VDTDHQADEAWLLSVQRKLYQWSKANPDGCYRELWNWVTDPRNLRCAWRRVASNRGARTAGIDGKTVGSICAAEGREVFLQDLRDDLRGRRFRPRPCRRKWIPKPGKPGKFRPLGIPTVTDRLVQGAIKNFLEPIFEAAFWHVSYGFRPGRGCHGALEHIRMTIRPRAKATDGRRHVAPYQWVIEGDIRSCFDQIDHHLLMQRVRARIGDLKVTRLVGQFLKAGVLEAGFLLPTREGTPQGGVISPLLANIALSAIEERYERWIHHRTKIRAHRTSDGVKAAERCRVTDRRRGLPVYFPVRYADDFVVLVAGSREHAETERAALADYLRQHAGLELSAEKTRITNLCEGFEFLGHRVRLKWHPQFGLMPRIEIPSTSRRTFGTRSSRRPKGTHPSILWPVASRSSILSCAAGAATTASAQGPAMFSVASTSMSGIGSGAGSCESTKGSDASVPDCGVYPVWFARTGKFGGRNARSSFFLQASLFSASGVVGCRCLPSPLFPESRMHNERCTSGSARDHAKPSIVRWTGAHGLLDCSIALLQVAHSRSWRSSTMRHMSRWPS